MSDWKEDLYYLPKDIETYYDVLRSIGDNFLAVGNVYMKNRLYSIASGLANLSDKARFIKNRVFETTSQEGEGNE